MRLRGLTWLLPAVVAACSADPGDPAQSADDVVAAEGEPALTPDNGASESADLVAPAEFSSYGPPPNFTFLALDADGTFYSEQGHGSAAITARGTFATSRRGEERVLTLTGDDGAVVDTLVYRLEGAPPEVLLHVRRDGEESWQELGQRGRPGWACEDSDACELALACRAPAECGTPERPCERVCTPSAGEDR